MTTASTVLRDRIGQEETAYVLYGVGGDTIAAGAIAAMPNLLLCAMGTTS